MLAGFAMFCSINRVIRFLLPLVVFLIPNTVLASASTSPVEIVQWVFENRREFYIEPADRLNFVSGRLKSFLYKNNQCASKGNICAIEVNPWTNMQDGEILGPISYKLVNQSITGATVEIQYFVDLSFLNKSKIVPRQVLVYLITSGNRSIWLLDDIFVSKAPFTFGQILERYQYY